MNIHEESSATFLISWNFLEIIMFLTFHSNQRQINLKNEIIRRVACYANEVLPSNVAVIKCLIHSMIPPMKNWSALKLSTVRCHCRIHYSGMAISHPSPGSPAASVLRYELIRGFATSLRHEKWRQVWVIHATKCIDTQFLILQKIRFRPDFN